MTYNLTDAMAIYGPFGRLSCLLPRVYLQDDVRGVIITQLTDTAPQPVHAPSLQPVEDHVQTISRGRSVHFLQSHNVWMR